MPRPVKRRVVSAAPSVTVFKPSGVPARDLSWTVMSLAEFEALRLVDGLGLSQGDAAVRMGVSRPTLCRIIGSARGKVAHVLAGGQALMLEAASGDAEGVSEANGESTLTEVRSMKVVVPAEGMELDAPVSARFGRAPCFVVVDMVSGEASGHPNEQNMQALQGAGVQSAQRIVDLGVDAVLAANFGPKAFSVLQAGGVALYTGASGRVSDTVEAFRNGSLPAAEAPNVASHWQ